MTDLEQLASDLADLYRTDGAVIWLLAPNRLLDGETPAELWARGEHDRVLGAVAALLDGVLV